MSSPGIAELEAEYKEVSSNFSKRTQADNYQLLKKLSEDTVSLLKHNSFKLREDAGNLLERIGSKILQDLQQPPRNLIISNYDNPYGFITLALQYLLNEKKLARNIPEALRLIKQYTEIDNYGNCLHDVFTPVFTCPHCQEARVLLIACQLSGLTNEDNLDKKTLLAELKKCKIFLSQYLYARFLRDSNDPKDQKTAFKLFNGLLKNETSKSFAYQRICYQLYIAYRDGKGTEPNATMECAFLKEIDGFDPCDLPPFCDNPASSSETKLDQTSAEVTKQQSSSRIKPKKNSSEIKLQQRPYQEIKLQQQPQKNKNSKKDKTTTCHKIRKSPCVQGLASFATIILIPVKLIFVPFQIGWNKYQGSNTKVKVTPLSDDLDDCMFDQKEQETKQQHHSKLKKKTKAHTASSTAKANLTEQKRELLPASSSSATTETVQQHAKQPGGTNRQEHEDSNDSGFELVSHKKNKTNKEQPAVNNCSSNHTTMTPVTSTAASAASSSKNNLSITSTANSSPASTVQMLQSLQNSKETKETKESKDVKELKDGKDAKISAKAPAKKTKQKTNSKLNADAPTPIIITQVVKEIQYVPVVQTVYQPVFFDSQTAQPLNFGQPTTSQFSGNGPDVTRPLGENDVLVAHHSQQRGR